MITPAVRLFARSARVLGVLTLLTGIAYPAVVTGLAWALFPVPAGGSLIVREGRVIGSRLIAQPFHDVRYFRGRPTTGAPANDPRSAGASNLAPTNPALDSLVRVRLAAWRTAGVTGPVPADLLTASASGLDPDISPAAALAQVPHVAAARGLPVADVTGLVMRHALGRTFGVLGEPRVNVLSLNLALDSLAR